VLLLDNFSGHGKLEDLQRLVPSWLKVEFLPENTTSTIQPLDGGIIARLKRVYRRQLLKLLVLWSEDPALTVDAFKKRINVLEAVRMIADAWDSIDAEAITKVWARTVLVSNTLTITQEGMTRARKVELEKLELEVRQGLLGLAATMRGREQQAGEDGIGRLMADMVDEFVTMWLDVDEGAGDEITIEEACASILEQAADEGEDEEGDEEEAPVPAHSEARRMIDELLRFFKHEGTDYGDLVLLNRLQRKVEEMAEEAKRQTVITDFFRV
jgi:hypothetical protein